MVHTNVGPLVFQEYHPSFPHELHTLGFAGRPGGPAFYISTQDNKKNHGPGSQGHATEADTCFAKISQGIEVVQRMKTQPGARPPSGFVGEPENFIKITSLKLIR